METEKPTGLYDVTVTPSGKFRTWRDPGTMECMVDGVWRSIPQPAQDEIKRLQEMVVKAMVAPLEDGK